MLHRYVAPQSGFLFLLVDGASAAEKGVFNISIDVKAPAPDDCAGPVFDAGEGGTVLGFISSLAGQQVGSCQSRLSLMQSEGIVKVTAPSDGSLEAQASSDNFVPALYARTSCGSADSEIKCDAASGGGPGPGGGQSGRATLSFEATPSSEVFLFVDGAGGIAAGRYLLKITP